MNLRQCVATAFLAAAATTITAGVATAEPTTTEVPASLQGSDHGVTYNLHRDGTALTADLTGGSFRVEDRQVLVADDHGLVIASLPLQLLAGDQPVAITPRTDSTATHLVADVATAKDIGYWEMTSPRQRSIGAGVTMGGLIGALGGIFVGLALGIVTMGLLLPLTLPVGLLVGLIGGMAAGGAAGAAVPNSDVPDLWQYQKECSYYGEYRYCW